MRHTGTAEVYVNGVLQADDPVNTHTLIITLRNQGLTPVIDESGPRLAYYFTLEEPSNP